MSKTYSRGMEGGSRSKSQLSENAQSVGKSKQIDLADKTKKNRKTEEVGKAKDVAKNPSPESLNVHAKSIRTSSPALESKEGQSEEVSETIKMKKVTANPKAAVQKDDAKTEPELS